jgi:hypothetical protein
MGDASIVNETNGPAIVQVARKLKDPLWLLPFTFVLVFLTNFVFDRWIWRKPESLLHEAISALLFAVVFTFLAPRLLRSARSKQ